MPADMKALMGEALAEPEEEPVDELEVVAEDLISAVASKDAAGVAAALRAAHDVCSAGVMEE